MRIPAYALLLVLLVVLIGLYIIKVFIWEILIVLALVTLGTYLYKRFVTDKS